jgi:hypothetical protein
MHRGDRILRVKRRQRVYSVPGLHFYSWRFWTGQGRAVAALGKAMTCRGRATASGGAWTRTAAVLFVRSKGLRRQEVQGAGHGSGCARGRSSAGRRWQGRPAGCAGGGTALGRARTCRDSGRRLLCRWRTRQGEEQTQEAQGERQGRQGAHGRERRATLLAAARG